MWGVHRQIAHAAGDRVYDPVYYSVSWFMPLEPERLHDSYLWQEKDYSYRYGGEILSLEDNDERQISIQTRLPSRTSLN